MTIGDSGKAWILTDCLAGRASSTSAARLQSVFFQVGVVCMGGTWVEISLRVVMGALVFILDE